VAIPFFHHAYIKKNAQERPYTAVAHFRYITRLQATQYVGSGNGLSTNYHHVVRMLTERENRIRKDGRVIEKFTIALPREMTMEQGIKTLHNFAFRLTRGRTPYLFSIQDWNEHNPHCHFILIDQDRETGKTVAKAWERNATHRFKRLWQDVANDDLAALGIDARIDFDAVEEKAQALRDALANDNEAVAEVAPISTDSAVEPPTESEEIPPEEFTEDEDEMARVVHDSRSPKDMTAEERVKAAIGFWGEHETIQHAIDQRDTAMAQYKTARTRAEAAALDAAEAIGKTAASEQRLHDARAQYDATHSSSGRAKGFTLSIFGKTLWQSKAAQRSAQAARDFGSANSMYEMALKDKEELEFTSKRRSTEANELLEKASMLERHVRVMGTDQELAAASEAYRNSIADHVGDMSLQELVVMVDEGEITSEECRSILTILGRTDDLGEFEEYERKNDEGQEI
jgi:hypothetical protein